MQSFIPSLQELSWRKLVVLFETLAMRVGDDGLHYISPRVVNWLEKIPDYVRTGLYERCLTSKLSLPTLMHFLAVSPQFAPASIDLRRSQRFNLGQLFSFIIKSQSSIESEISTIKMEATPPAARRAASVAALHRPQSPAPPSGSGYSGYNTSANAPPASPAAMRKALMQRIKSALTSLRSVDVSANVWFNDIILMQVTMLCPNLESLNISYCKKLNASSIASALGNCCSTLTQLDLSWSAVTDNSLRALTMLTNLQFLAISFCKNCSGAGISALIETPSMAQLLTLDLKGCVLNTSTLRSKSLRHLNVSHTDFSDFSADQMACPYLTEFNVSYCTKVHDEALSRLISRCKELLLLDIQFCSQLTTASFAAPELRVILLNDCKQLGDSAIQQICTHCPRLSEVQARATMISDASLRVLGQYGRIQVLNLSRCPFISNEGIRAILQTCPYLRDLDVSFNASLGSDETVSAVEAHCSSLKLLKVFGCAEIPAGAIQTLRRRNPELDVCCATSSLDWAMYTAIS